MAVGAAFALFVVFFVVIIVVSSASKAAGGGAMRASTFDQLVANGVPARGILLAVDSNSMPVEGLGTTRVQQRGVTIDVEIPGRPPYTVTTMVMVPSNLSRDVLPGATVELRVHGRNNSRIAIVGPGAGFAAPALLAPGAASQDQRYS